jgi:hypothetical protein
LSYFVLSFLVCFVGLGYEAWLYAMVRVARCECCLQWGFDETSIDGVPTLNQWVLLAEPGKAPSVGTIECAGILVGNTREEIAAHIEQSWANGQTAVGLLREELGGLADALVHLTNGGVLLHKLQGVMHDTCHTANKTARLSKVVPSTLPFSSTSPFPSTVTYSLNPRNYVTQVGNYISVTMNGKGL